jgi:hypothetical protein
MESSVRYARLEGLKKPARQTNIASLCIVDEDKIYCIYNDGTHYRSTRVRPLDYVRFPIIPNGSGPYPPERFLQHMQDCGRPAMQSVKRLVEKYFPAYKLTVEMKEGSRGELIMRVSNEFGLEPRKIRKLLRKEGVRYPYESEEVVRSAIRHSVRSSPKPKRKLRD